MKRFLLIALLLPSIANAATERIVYINTDGSNGDGSAGTPYSNLYNALNAETKTLVSSDRQLTIYARGATNDTTDFNSRLELFAGNTDATRYIRIVGDPNSSAGANQGKLDETRYQITNTNYCTIGNNFVASSSRLDYRFENLQIYNGNVGAGNRTAFCGDKHPGDVRFIGNVIHQNMTAGAYGSSFAFRLDQANATKISEFYLINNIIYDVPSAAVSWKSYGTGSKLVIYNNTFSETGSTGGADLNGAINFSCQTGTSDIVSVKNNLMQNSTGNAYTQNYPCETYVTANNITEDATSPDVAYRSKTVTFVNEASDDFHLASGDTNAKDAGANLSADSYFPFATDIDRNTRSAPWDIGADEYQSSGPSLLLLKHAMEN